MPDVIILIGGREFSVSCQEGEEHYLKSAAELLNTEASALTAQIGQLPETRMLLMAGLMLADKTAGTEDRVKELQGQVAGLQSEIEQLKSAPRPEPEKIEVPVIPEIVTDSLAALAERAEGLAAKVEEKVAG